MTAYAARSRDRSRASPRHARRAASTRFTSGELAATAELSTLATPSSRRKSSAAKLPLREAIARPLAASSIRAAAPWTRQRRRWCRPSREFAPAQARMIRPRTQISHPTISRDSPMNHAVKVIVRPPVAGAPRACILNAARLALGGLTATPLAQVSSFRAPEAPSLVGAGQALYRTLEPSYPK